MQTIRVCRVEEQGLEQELYVEQRTAGCSGKKKVLGITGGVGSGKSAVLAYLQEKYKARVIQADEVGRLLQTPGHDCYDRIVDAFGTETLDPQGNLRRDLLAEKAFADPLALRKLNGIMHPSVKKYIVEQIAEEQRNGEAPFVVVEAALLLEDHYDLVCDEIWYIYAGEETRIRRLTRSRGYTEEKARSIMANQMSEAEFRERCEFAIDNDSDFIENTYGQIDKGLMEHGFLQYCQR